MGRLGPQEQPGPPGQKREGPWPRVDRWVEETRITRLAGSTARAEEAGIQDAVADQEQPGPPGQQRESPSPKTIVRTARTRTTRPAGSKAGGIARVRRAEGMPIGKKYPARRVKSGRERQGIVRRAVPGPRNTRPAGTKVGETACGRQRERHRSDGACRAGRMR
jgi:hypothetical protein